ncbi:Permease of the drug/metabolite transporter (DMT) superfamily [Marinobacterium lacunae]|uniref:Permease of the drug/metabolite transporter (DMT) superfamily n=1 Tax=Marinobacterium lacunae TaxID=1232683 RepID=A0A081FWL7_9GAMM|nr:DMT family transporter [Marinobacterium lacunae]KEA62922.1 Permease of the drug/metabolite transporter (DMT) superfamily [Marinobacterium lacunae]
MSLLSINWAAFGSTSLFVLLWSSGAIFSKWGLDYASPFAFLLLRFALAASVLFILGRQQRQWRPQPGTAKRVALAGTLLIGSYSICYFLALDQGITPGVLATVLGAQPVLTLALLERGFQPLRLLGLLLAIAGLVLVMWKSITEAHFSLAGMLFALGALLSMTAGAILQKGIRQSPLQVLPLQYGLNLVICLLTSPLQPLTVQWTWGFVLSWIWLALVISVVAQLLLYRMIQHGNLVNVTSLFYLVPVVTALMDFVFLGNLLPWNTLAGMVAILLGVMLVYRV